MVKSLPFAGTHITLRTAPERQQHVLCFDTEKTDNGVERKKKQALKNMRGKQGIVIAKIGIENRGRSLQQNGAEDEEKN